MSSPTQATYERKKLSEIAADYRARGYEVLMQPDPADLPEFLAGFRPDLVARRPRDSVVVELKIGTETAVSERYRELAEAIQREPGWRFSLVVVDPRSDNVAPSAEHLLARDEILDRLAKAREFFEVGSRDAAFMLLWTSLEALLRQISVEEGLPLERVPSSALVKELYSLGILSRSDLERTERALAVRNCIVHGFEASGLDHRMIEELTDLATRLLAESCQSSA